MDWSVVFTTFAGIMAALIYITLAFFLTAIFWSVWPPLGILTGMIFFAGGVAMLVGLLAS